ncbi:hypothetical protein ACWEQ8_14635 [Streptomyces noursei]
MVALRRVVFAGADRYGPHGPAITYEQLRDLVAVDRGADYVPRCAEASSFLSRWSVVRPGRRLRRIRRRPVATGARAPLSAVALAYVVIGPAMITHSRRAGAFVWQCG